jgi:diguanylate cyclase (GGDEF)-like protein
VAWAEAGLAIATIGWIDYVSGVELRVYPLYFLPISLLAWRLNRIDAAVAAVVSAGTWLGSNLLAGLSYSSPVYWVANTIVHAASFATVGVLIATLRAAVTRERQFGCTDALTGLLNTRAFYGETEAILALCRRKGRPVTMAYVDLDDFKDVNDTLGHRAGDELLRTVAETLRQSTRPSDLCARLGGDEFAVLLPELDAAAAAVPLERLRSRLSQAAASTRRPVSASIGAVTFPTVPDSVDAMVVAADAQMYRAKAAGKNQVHLVVAGSEAVPTAPGAAPGT